MKTNIVRFYFKKVDGTHREAWGKLNPKLRPETNCTERKRNETFQTYFDTVVQAFRCFKRFNLLVF